MASSEGLDETRDRLQKHFAEASNDHNASKWSALWTQEFTPWDRGLPNPALFETLTQHEELFDDSVFADDSQNHRRKRALVPGCGKGYDVMLLASFGYDAYGLEIASGAIEGAKKLSVDEAEKYPAINEEVGRGKTEFIQGDFFSNEWESQIEGGASFDIIYDYTFLCALDPPLRPAWAERMSQLLGNKPDSSLICLEFPTYKDPAIGGPPHGLPAKVYVGHLSNPGKPLDYDDKGDLSNEALLTEPAKNALVVVKRWKPVRTHDVGEDTDWVSVWRHRA
ncbi:MAG: hypothetical protein M1814_002219 [Vezdaea aestivalis]|nr:MAG: hypothetical protein M1814_002219 [Vezdaea aestivalis]